MLDKLFIQDQPYKSDTEPRALSKHDHRKSSDIIVKRKDEVKRHKFLLTEEEDGTT